MSSYGRNFEFRAPPTGASRAGGYIVPKVGSKLPLGVPVKVDTSAAVNDLGLQPVVLATTAQAPRNGTCGVLVFEYGPAAFAGDDPYLTTFSDKDTAPLGAAVQMVSDPEVSVMFRNTADQTFLNTRAYPGRMMIAGLGATLTLAVGDMLTPGVGNDTDGYWAETSDATKAWLVVTNVDNARLEVVARFLF